MRLLLIALLALSLESSRSLAAERFGDNILLTSCEKVVVDDLDYIFVEASRPYPSQAQVKILYTNKIMKSIFVGIHEWQERSISLPSQNENGISYRLIKFQNKWQILRSTNSDIPVMIPINCSERA